MTQPIDTNALRGLLADDHERGCEGRCYSCSCGYDAAVEQGMKDAADELDRLHADLSEERHAHNKTQFDLAQARKERALIVAWLRDGAGWNRPWPSFVEYNYWSLANDIEAGEHLKGQTDGYL